MRRLIASSSLTLLLAASATGEPQGEKKKDREKGFRNPEFATMFFSKLDKNEDGKVDQDEFSANPRLEKASPEQQATLFQRLDKNSDGFIQRDELKPPKPGPRGERPKWLQQGPVSYEQFSKQPRVQRLNEEMRRKLFDRMDQNGDGVLSKEDSPRHRGGGGRPGGRSEGGPQPKGNIDTNDDGKVSFSEFQQAPFNKGLTEDEAEDRFEALDQNNDGFLTPDERKEGPGGREPRQRERQEGQKP